MMEPDAFRALVYERAEKERRRTKKRGRALISAAVVLAVLIPVSVFGLTRGRTARPGLSADDRQPAQATSSQTDENETALPTSAYLERYLLAVEEKKGVYADKAAPQDGTKALLLSVPGWETQAVDTGVDVTVGDAPGALEDAMFRSSASSAVMEAKPLTFASGDLKRAFLLALSDAVQNPADVCSLQALAENPERLTENDGGVPEKDRVFCLSTGKTYLFSPANGLLLTPEDEQARLLTKEQTLRLLVLTSAPFAVEVLPEETE